jgi:tetratricopeptide (TPR) repeat protein/GGDEF domain-containing protein
MPDVSKRVQKAEKYLLKGKTLDALQEYLQAYQEDPSNDSLVEIIAELYLKQNQTERALECYGYLFDKNVEQGNGPGAVLVYRKMARLGVKDVGRLLVCAGFQEKDKPHEARESYRACAQAFEESGDKARAIEALTRLAVLEEKNADVHVRLGRLAESAGKTELAAKCFVKGAALLRAPGAAADAAERGLHLLSRAHEIEPGNHPTSALLAAALIQAGKPEEAIPVLEPLPANAFPERSRQLADCYLQAGRLDRAEELYWALAAKSKEAFDPLLRLAERLLDEEALDRALTMLPRLKQEMFAADKDKQFQGWIEKLRREKSASLPVLRFLTAAYRELNLDSQRAEVSAKLFDAAMEAGDHALAAGTLEALAELETTTAENEGRLERLAGKVDEARFKSLSSLVRRTAGVGAAAGAGPAFDWPGGDRAPAAGATANTLDDALLEAELLVQFTGKEAAAQYVRKLLETYPGQEQTNTRLRALMVEAGMSPGPAALPEAPAPPAPRQAPAAAPPLSPLADIRRVSELSRSINRQGSVKEILSLVVNEIGKGTNASRCLAGLCVPGKLPSAAMEYCAAGTRGSDPASVHKLITVLSQATADGKPLVADQAAFSPRLAPLAPALQALAVGSLLALPLMDGDQQTGVIVLEQCGARSWNTAEMEAIEAIAQQVVLALSRLKLRSIASVVTDGRSGFVLSRSAYLDCLLRECEKAQHQGAPLCAALLEFFDPARLPEAAAHEDIDRRMREAAEMLVGQLRQQDIGVRYDDVTLAVIFPTTRAAEALPVIDKVRRLAAAKPGDGQQALAVTCGLAEAIVRRDVDPADSVTEWINRLEAALEAARRKTGSTAELPAPKK